MNSMAKVVNMKPLPNMPWEDCPKGFEGPIWRYSGNPIIKRNPNKVVARAFNSALVPLISNVLKNGRDDHQMLLNNMFVIFICGSIISPLLSLSCYDLLINKIKLWFFITRKYKSDVTSIPLSQKKLNQYFESPNMNVSYQYSFLCKLVLKMHF